LGFSGTPLRIIGIDPGLASVGYGVIEAAEGRLGYLAHGCFETSSAAPIEERLLAIFSSIAKLLETWRPQAGGMESLYFARNVSSALPVAEAKGVIRLAFAQACVPLREYAPNALKTAVTGSARAEKAQVQEMVRLLLGLAEAPKPDHAADALAAAICRWHHEGPLAAP
jgi:crossover junction endodeoxyribonuclease RuvC